MIEIRKLMRKDLRKVTWLDKESENNVGDWVAFIEEDQEADAFGLFVSGKLLAYYTVDEILEGCDYIEGFPPATEYMWYINNVYVKYSERGKGYGKQLLQETLKDKPFPIRLISLTPSLVPYYEKLGFKEVYPQCMEK